MFLWIFFNYSNDINNTMVLLILYTRFITIIDLNILNGLSILPNFSGISCNILNTTREMIA